MILGKYLQGIHEETSLDTHRVSWIKKTWGISKNETITSKMNAHAYRYFVFEMPHEFLCFATHSLNTIQKSKKVFMTIRWLPEAIAKGKS